MKKLDFDFFEKRKTYMTANKYHASSLIDDLTEHIEDCEENVCPAYDQLL